MTALCWSLTPFNLMLSVHRGTTHFALTQCYKSAALLSGAQPQKRLNEEVKVILKRPQIVEIQINVHSFPGNWHLFGVTAGVCVCSHQAGPAGYTKDSISYSQALQTHHARALVCVWVCVRVCLESKNYYPNLLKDFSHHCKNDAQEMCFHGIFETTHGWWMIPLKMSF